VKKIGSCRNCYYWCPEKPGETSGTCERFAKQKSFTNYLRWHNGMLVHKRRRVEWIPLSAEDCLDEDDNEG